MKKSLLKTIACVVAATTVMSAMVITSNASRVPTHMISVASSGSMSGAPQIVEAPTPVYGLVDTGTWWSLVIPGK
ncbi:MAG: hypothetical protein MJ094_08515, partial [Saccharofermentans sp.]|nr:hypothetical protein [Saccharofermentans sp.]